MKKTKKFGIFSLVFSSMICMMSLQAFAQDAVGDLGGAFSEQRVTLAIETAIQGMLMIFLVLSLLWLILSISKIFFYTIPNNKKEKAKKIATAVEQVVAQEEVETVEQTVENVQEIEDGELIAVITAAISAMIDSGEYQEEFAGGFRVVSFRRTKENGSWNRK